MSDEYPPPLSAEELLARADLAGRARVLSVKTAPDGSYRIARLRFESVTKGRIPGRHPILRILVGPPAIEVRMRTRAKGPNGEALRGQWTDGYRPGDVVITHLCWNDEIGAYATLWWNAVWLTPH